MAENLIRIDVRKDIAAVQRDLDKVRRELVPKAAARALNKTNRFVITRVIREIASSLNISPQRRVRNRVKIGRGPGFIATATDLRAGALVLMSYVPEIWVIGGIRSARSSENANRFVATMPNGHTGLYFRKAGSRHRRRPDGQMTELPIGQFYVDRQDQANSAAQAALAQHGVARFLIEFPRALRSLGLS